MSWTWEDKQYFHVMGIELQDDQPPLPPAPLAWENWEFRLLEDHEAKKQPLRKRMAWYWRWAIILGAGSPLWYLLIWGALEGHKHVGR